MRSLDILIPTRPKPEAGRPSTGDEAGSRAAPDFEAMLGSLEEGKAAAEAKAAAEETESPAPEARAATETAPLSTAVIAPTGSALQALMALAAPAATTTPVAASPAPEAGLAAMVQRAAARSATTPATTPEMPSPQVTVLGLETHFAPVRPSLPVSAPVAAAGGQDEAPILPAPPPLPAAGEAAPALLARKPSAGPSTVQEIVPGRTRVTDAVIPAPQVSSGDATPTASRTAEASTGATIASAPPSPTNIPEAGPAQAAPPVAHTPSAASEAAPIRTFGGSPATAASGSTPTSSDTAQDSAAVDNAAPAAPALIRPATTGANRGRIAEAPTTPPTPSQARTVTQAETPSAPLDPAPAQVAGSAALQTVATLGRAALRSDRPGSAAVSGTDAPAQAEPEEAGSAASGTPAQASSPTPVPARHAAPIVAERPFEGAHPNPTPERAAASMQRETETSASGPRQPEGSAVETAAPGATAASSTAATVPAQAGLPASPQRQIVDAVTAQLAAAAPASQTRPVTSAIEAGPLKILTLQLQPADLGTVLVRMRLQDGRLEMSLRTSREDTAERLQKEGSLLSGLLREAGYQADTVMIEAGGAGSTGDFSPRGQGASSFEASGGQRDRQPGEAAPDHSGRRPSPQRDEAALPSEEKDHETVSGGRDRRGLYL
ncbi:MAG TPA: flagellar hook-length control protein FliK [Methylorubrum populi]|uniref:Flagellar hook-length control protein FliK n=1 Tax=Methylorubrum populi TaxID=223967 RepID=A0A921JDS8_9HYPH|nr:flagellar hook-length control protein FliK [Methylorubrum populi]